MRTRTEKVRVNNSLAKPSGWLAQKTDFNRLCLLLLGLFILPAPALADLKLCNSTTSRVGVAIGYQDAKGWATEGWWNIASESCETLLRGELPSRYVYVHAIDYDRGGEWVGKNAMCTHRKSFAIRGVQECKERGYKRTGFFEVDTGQAREWTIRLTDPGDSGGANPK